ncbi:hypothetical protein CZ797_14270 [Pseudoalteromonas sp. JB197]|nr:hypothetical protein CZ797_14270 [Pseudoalteromonas sp. JB197]
MYSYNTNLNVTETLLLFFLISINNDFLVWREIFYLKVFK